MFFAIIDHIYHPHDIHGWKATDLSLDLAPSDQNLMHPTSRQNFGDAPGQTPKLILTLCHNQFHLLVLENQEMVRELFCETWDSESSGLLSYSSSGPWVVS